MGEFLCALGRANQRAQRADHRKNAGDVALVEDVDVDPGADEIGDDAGLQVGEGEHQIRFQCQHFWDVRRDEGRHPRLLTPHLRRADGIAGDADDAVLLAEQIERFDRLFGQADDAAGREVAHGRSICPNESADVTAAMTSDVIALPREAIHAATTRNWEEI